MAERFDKGEGGGAGVTSPGPVEGPSRRRRLTAGRIVCILGIVVAFGLIGAGQLAPLWTPFDLFNHFLIHLLVLAVACLVALLMPRAAVWTVLVLMLIGVISIGLWPHYMSHGAPAPISARAGEQIVRVMSFNSRLLNPDWQAVADEIRRHDPDIVALVEMGRGQEPLFEALAASYPHRVDCLDETYCNLAILSKFAFERTESRARWRGPAVIRADFGSDLGHLTVIGLHASRPPYFATHLEQMTVLGAALADIGRPQIVMGDFNATPYSYMLKALTERSRLERISHLPTWPANLSLPQIAIDHIFLTPDLRLAGAVRIGNHAGSDHYPLIAEIAVPAR